MKAYYEAQTTKYINGDLLQLVKWRQEPQELEEHKAKTLEEMPKGRGSVGLP